MKIYKLITLLALTFTFSTNAQITSRTKMETSVCNMKIDIDGNYAVNPAAAVEEARKIGFEQFCEQKGYDKPYTLQKGETIANAQSQYKNQQYYYLLKNAHGIKACSGKKDFAIRTGGKRGVLKLIGKSGGACIVCDYKTPYEASEKSDKATYPCDGDHAGF